MDLSDIPVLIVDDDWTSRSLTLRILSRIGFADIQEAEDGTKALEALNTLEVAFVVCDVHMQPMDGFTLVTKLRSSKNAALKTLPVIMLTSEMRADAVKVSEKLGVVAYVVKPTSLLELKGAVEKALGIEIG